MPELIFDPIALGKRLHTARTVRGFSQQDLGARAGVTQHYISQLETGTRGRQLGLETAWRLCFVLGLSLDTLAGMPDIRG
jgi:transcriptional regulator with XRE-family HTH domain